MGWQGGRGEEWGGVGINGGGRRPPRGSGHGGAPGAFPENNKTEIKLGYCAWGKGFGFPIIPRSGGGAGGQSPIMGADLLCANCTTIFWAGGETRSFPRARPASPKKGVNK